MTPQRMAEGVTAELSLRITGGPDAGRHRNRPEMRHDQEARPWLRRKRPSEGVSKASSLLDSAGRVPYNPVASGRPDFDGWPFHGAQVAQLVEQRTENPRVAGSIPALGTIFSMT